MFQACNFDFRDKENGSKTLKGNLSRFDIKDENEKPGNVLKMEIFHEKLANFRYPHCALLLTCEKANGDIQYMRIDRTRARDSCYVGTSQNNVRTGNPYLQIGCLPQVLHERTFVKPIDFHVFRLQLLKQSRENFALIRRGCKWFSSSLWTFILNNYAESVYGLDDPYVVQLQKERDCERIYAFMNWTYWLGSWIMR